ncbi:unnamed protein product [Polarella glacialis]|uniref:30S ribosomal protein S15 n=1 Tax=Polarella glacialis TaxID=89957 RepID=A0A813IFY5_POLGL|nr:unnamed protein product [Polarella glacialis]CAE8612105.1 unnamed protein product [Polarella glacialis]CAE8649899.1 unnamed protein product [Polarella glacialis]
MAGVFRSLPVCHIAYRMRRSPSLAVLAGCVAALWASPVTLGFVSQAPASGRVQLPLEESAVLSRRTAATVPPATYDRCLASIGAVVMACGMSAAVKRRDLRRQRALVQRFAEGEDQSIMGTLGSVQREDDEAAKMMEQGMKRAEKKSGGKDDVNWFDQLSEQDLARYLKDGGRITAQDSEEALARKGARQQVFNLAPSKQYVLYIAKKAAQKTWTKDGPDGRNIGCLEVQVAVLTERIRSMVLHVREFKQDYKCRLKLISMVGRRQRYLDKLAWKDLDSYLKIRSELKIRHVYRMEALIGRLPGYKYAMENRKQAPGRRVIMRLKKTKKLLTNRLASQLKQGKSSDITHRTKKKLLGRRWMTSANDEMKAIVSGKAHTEYLDPLNLP